MQLNDIIVHGITLDLTTVAHRPPLALEVEAIRPRVLASAASQMVWGVEYTFHGVDSTGARIFEGSVRLALFVQCGPDEYREAMLVPVLRIAHDELRQLLHAYTAQMGLPPLALDLARMDEAAIHNGPEPKASA